MRAVKAKALRHLASKINGRKRTKVIMVGDTIKIIRGWRRIYQDLKHAA